MKPIRLELRGFTAFRDKTVVDFEGKRLFAITGATGAGKSSLLDAMTWALYGRVPRVGNQAMQLRSHGATVMAVLLEFDARGERYRVARSRGPSSAQSLERRTPAGDWEPLEHLASGVNDRVRQVLGIDYETFTKTVVLPQGQFAAFLSGDPKDKKDILSELLGLGVYKQMMQTANARASGANSAADALQGQWEQLAFKTAEALAEIEEACAALEQRGKAVAAKQTQVKQLDVLAQEYKARTAEADAATLAAKKAAAEAAQAQRAAEDAATTLDTATTAAVTLAAELAGLEYDEGAHHRLEQQVAAAEAAAAALTALAAAERATSQAREAERAACAAAEQHDAAARLAATALEGGRTALSAAATWARAAACGLEADAAEAGRARTEAQQKSHDYQLRGERLRNLSQHLATLRREHETADSEVHRATAAAATAAAGRVQAEAADRDAIAAVEAARERLDSARAQDAAAALLSTLKVGDPCPVCGEPIHELRPHAAPDVGKAERALAKAEQAHERARTAHQQRGNEAAAAHAHAEAARAKCADVEAKLAALDEDLAAAAVTRTTIDRTAKRASTAAAAEHDRSVEAQQRAEVSSKAAQYLGKLLAQLPPGVLSDREPKSSLPPLDEAEALVHALAGALETHATAGQAAEAAAKDAQQAAALVQAAAAEAEKAAALQVHHAATLTKAEQALAGLGAEGIPVADLRASLDAARRAAARAKQLATEVQAAEQKQAAATAVVEERRAACTTATAAVATAELALQQAAAAAQDARAVFEADWRGCLPPQYEPDFDTLAKLLAGYHAEAERVAHQLGATQAQLEAGRSQVAQAAQLQQDVEGYRRSAAVAKDLGQELQANNFVAFIQREAMHALAGDAAERMLQLSRGRYRLHADEDEFAVIDHLNGDEHRSVKTLSGGETFLASLALALALSERLPELSGHGGVLSLESLFLDEGFGSLDAESLDVAIDGLELLAGGNRMIGVISHVPEVAERLPERIEVVKVGSVSTIRKE